MALGESKPVIYGVSFFETPTKIKKSVDPVERIEIETPVEIAENRDLRVRRVVINMCYDEYDHVKTSAKRHGRSMSAYIREALLEKSELIGRQYEIQDKISENIVAKSLESEKASKLKLLEMERRFSSKLIEAERSAAQKLAEHAVEIAKLQIKIAERDRQIILYKESYKTSLPASRAKHMVVVETPPELDPSGPSAQLLKSMEKTKCPVID